jgi:hypothetical protein
VPLGVRGEIHWLGEEMNLEPGEGAGDAAFVLFAQRVGRKASFAHGHERRAIAVLERELDRGVEARAVRSRFGGGSVFRR